MERVGHGEEDGAAENKSRHTQQQKQEIEEEDNNKENKEEAGDSPPFASGNEGHHDQDAAQEGRINLEMKKSQGGDVAIIQQQGDNEKAAVTTENLVEEEEEPNACNKQLGYNDADKAVATENIAEPNTCNSQSGEEVNNGADKTKLDRSNNEEEPGKESVGIKKEQEQGRGDDRERNKNIGDGGDAMEKDCKIMDTDTSGTDEKGMIAKGDDAESRKSHKPVEDGEEPSDDGELNISKANNNATTNAAIGGRQDEIIGDDDDHHHPVGSEAKETKSKEHPNVVRRRSVADDIKAQVEVVEKKILKVDRWGTVVTASDQNDPENPNAKADSEPLEKDELKWEIKWAEMLGKWSKYKDPEKVSKIKQRIRAGIADAVRGAIWPKLCGADIVQQKAPGLYQSLLSKDLKEGDEIQLAKDLHRTDPRNVIFYNKGIGQESLYNVLKAYCLYNPKVGYCQGMGSLASLLLTYVPEETAFFIMDRLMSHPKYSCAGLYERGFPELMKQLQVFTRLMRKLDPKLANLLGEKGVDPVIYAFRWFQGRFYEFPKELFIRVFDIYLLEGKKIIYRLALYLILSRRKEFFKAKDEEIFALARDIRSKPYTKEAPNAKKLIDRAIHKIRVTRKKIDKYERAYEKEVNTNVTR
eukprot:jgi/Bigna1/91731/estExt_fgenesh1_pg.C_1150037